MTNWELYLATHRNGGTSSYDENQNKAIAKLQEDILKKVNVFPSTIETNYPNYPLSPGISYIEEIDFNDFASNQFYQVDIGGFNDPINAPPSGSEGTLLYIKNTQIFIDKNNQIWSRIYTDSWSDWKAANNITQEQKEEIGTYVYNTYIRDPNQTLENALNGNFPSSLNNTQTISNNINSLSSSIPNNSLDNNESNIEEEQ